MGTFGKWFVERALMLAIEAYQRWRASQPAQFQTGESETLKSLNAAKASLESEADGEEGDEGQEAKAKSQKNQGSDPK